MSGLDNTIAAKLHKIRLLEEKNRIREGLPHLHGFKMYAWSRRFFESRSRMTLLCAANQVSKSSTQIRKVVEWATNVELWPKLWPTRPRQFWYLYPNKDVATTEFQMKWIPEFMPRGEFKEHPIYGWEAEYDLRKKINAIRFKSGVVVFFKTYSQDVQDLQTATVHAVFTDEELPVPLYDELSFRLAGTDGYFHMVFTATLGQDLWRRAMERIGKDDEMFKDALKIQVSMYDCLKYEDGSETPWTTERIERIKRQCKSSNEVLRRIYGRFVMDEGLIYSAYDSAECRTATFPAPPVPKLWQYYAGIDVGSGGLRGHPAAVVVVAVSPDYKKGRVVRAWRGDGIATTAGDVLEQYCSMVTGLSVVQCRYDHGAKDLSTVAERLGVPVLPADKSHALGFGVVNTLFKTRQLSIDRSEEWSDLDKLDTEICSITHQKGKDNKDDLADALRYACATIPWHFEESESTRAPRVVSVDTVEGGVDELARMGRLPADYGRYEEDEIESECSEWNSLY